MDWEHAASGRAMGPVLDFAISEVGASPWLRQARAEVADEDEGHLVVEHPDEPACALARDLVLTVLGLEAGNMGLRHMATGGVWLVGGVAVRLARWLRGGPFQAAFETRGAFTRQARSLPRRLVLDDHVGLRGAAVVARELL